MVSSASKAPGIAKGVPVKGVEAGAVCVIFATKASPPLENCAPPKAD